VVAYNASMEPRSSERGNDSRAFYGMCKYLASMEPRSSERGNEESRRVQESQRHPASMEPRSSERGNQHQDQRDGSTRIASMEPRSSERGNVIDPMSYLYRFGSFNGATFV